MWYTTCGTYSQKAKSTTSFYVVLIPRGIGKVVLLALSAISKLVVVVVTIVAMKPPRTFLPPFHDFVSLIY